MRWLDRGLLVFGLVAIAGFSFLRDKPLPTVDLRPLQAEVAQMREELTAHAASRCMNVTTQTLQVSVYDTPNLGTKKVGK